MIHAFNVFRLPQKPYQCCGDNLGMVRVREGVCLAPHGVERLCFHEKERM